MSARARRATAKVLVSMNSNLIQVQMSYSHSVSSRGEGAMPSQITVSELRSGFRYSATLSVKSLLSADEEESPPDFTFVVGKRSRSRLTD